MGVGSPNTVWTKRRTPEAGKWLGQVPVSFVREDGFLCPNLTPDYEEGVTGYFDIVDALVRDESYNSVAKRTPNVTRQTLSTIDNGGEQHRWYGDDLDQALDET
ncbi:hypothetical protein ACH9L7_07755 [Haloferax sp. S1W]|uniref:hypothetical protein n=1 Tax=Haloferax sp. S1W TaxID=3377110 RepID=UPI0037C7BA45